MPTWGTKGALLAALLVLAAAVASGAGAQAPPENPGASAGENAAGGPGNSEDAPGQNKEDPGAQGAAGDPPGCNGTIHLSASGSAVQGTDPKYTRGETVFVHGSGFDANETFTRWTLEDVNDHTMIVPNGGGWSASADGSFAGTPSHNTSSLMDAHEYKITVYWTEMLPNGEAKECQKSKNFFLVGAAEQAGGPAPTGGQPPTGGGEQPTPGAAPTPTPTAPRGGVAGEEKTVTPKAAAAKIRRAGRVAGLPFTGFPVWALALAGAALAAGGFGLRRAGASR